MEAAGCSCNALADACGLSPSTLSRYLTGARVPNADTLPAGKMAHALCEFARQAQTDLDESEIREELLSRAGAKPGTRRRRAASSPRFSTPLHITAGRTRRSPRLQPRPQCIPPVLRNARAGEFFAVRPGSGALFCRTGRFPRSAPNARKSVSGRRRAHPRATRDRMAVRRRAGPASTRLRVVLAQTRRVRPRALHRRPAVREGRRRRCHRDGRQRPHALHPLL